MPLARPVSFTRPARADVIAAEEWYDEQTPGLGARFRGELESVVERIAESPLQFPLVSDDARRARLGHFPYLVLFRPDPDAITVIGCFHASRDPREWRRRVHE